MRQLLHDLTPPLLQRYLRQVRRACRLGAPPDWEYVSNGWQEPGSASSANGWDVVGVRETYAARWPTWVRNLEGAAPLAISPETDLTPPADDRFNMRHVRCHNTIVSFAYALSLASRNKVAVSMLDWGGGMGHYYPLSQSVLPDVVVEYHCKDMATLSEEGRRLFPQAHFYSEDACLERSYDFVLASGSLHFSPDWETILQRLAAAASPYLFVTRLPIVHQALSYVFVQRARDYRTAYHGWCLNRGQFLQSARRAGAVLLREFIIGEQPDIYRAPEPCEYRAFLFKCSA